jgi:hypothetical protein
MHSYEALGEMRKVMVYHNQVHNALMSRCTRIGRQVTMQSLMQRSTRYYPMPSILPLENLLEVPILTGAAAADLNRVICRYLEDNEYLHIPHKIYLSGNILPPLHLSLQDNMLPVTSLNPFSATMANHGAELTE